MPYDSSDIGMNDKLSRMIDAIFGMIDKLSRMISMKPRMIDGISV